MNRLLFAARIKPWVLVVCAAGGMLLSATGAFAATANDGCDTGGGPNDIEKLTATIWDESKLVVVMHLCAPADAATKYQVYLDWQAGLAIDDDRNSDGAVDGADFCFPTADETMKHQGDKDTGPGSITVEEDVITFEVELAELGIFGPLTEEHPLLVWATAKIPQTPHDRVPDTDAANGCSEPESLAQVLFLPEETAVVCPQACHDGILAEIFYANSVPGVHVINRPQCGFDPNFGGWYISRIFTSFGYSGFSGAVSILNRLCVAGHVDENVTPLPTHTTYVFMDLKEAEQVECVKVMGPFIVANTGYSCNFPP